MQKQKREYYVVSDVAKQLWISFEELRLEFAECGIGVRDDDKVTAQTLEYVLSWLTHNEIDWGDHLHLETGDAVWEIQWMPMRGNEWDESRYHDLSVTGWATRLWVSYEVLLHELHTWWWKWGKDDIVSYATIKDSINAIEYIDSLETFVQTQWQYEGNSTEYLRNEYGEYTISEMAYYLGVPATSLLAWLTMAGGNVYAGTMHSQQTIAWSMKDGKLDWMHASTCKTSCDWSEEMSCTVIKDKCCLEKESISSSWLYANESQIVNAEYWCGDACDIPEWIVAVGTPVEAGLSFDKFHAWVARWLLWFLALPLLFWLSADNKNTLDTVQNKVNTAPMVIHWSADDEPRDTEIEVLKEDWRREDHADTTVKSIMERPTTGSQKNNPGAVQQNDAEVHNTAKDFVESLSEKVGKSEDFKKQIREQNSHIINENTHGSALPSILPKTWTQN